MCEAVGKRFAPLSLAREWRVKLTPARRILIVDDNADAADLTAELLRHFGLSVEVAYGGPEALAAVKAIVPDVIFLDIGMPVMDGYAVAKALRREADLAHVRIIALTAWGDQGSREKTRAAGFDLHLTKPARLADLLDSAN